MVQIKDIISVNRQATLVKGVQLSWYNNPDKIEDNNRLAVGYVFGNSSNPTITSEVGEISSLALSEHIRDALNGNYSENIFTVIARYGHGKSHFALMLANYFGLPEDSPVVKEIIEHIEACSDSSTASHFRAFKKINKKPVLVVTLSGTDIQDLRQGFLKALRRALDLNTATKNYSIKATSTEAAKWLKNLPIEIRHKAEEYINEQYSMDLDALIEALENFDTEKEEMVKKMSQTLIGIAGDFGSQVSLREVIGQVIKDLCEGNEAPFSRMLILFDELGVYSEKWCNNRMAAGYDAPQQLTDACNDHSRKICLVTFVQREIGEIVKNYPLKDECMKWAKRLPEKSQFKLISHLEEVISKIILPNDKDKWEKVIRDNAPRLQEQSEFARNSFEAYKSWDKTKFFQTVTRDCYPLHPITTGILCNLDFTQEARSVIEAVGALIKTVEDKSTSDHGNLTLVNPIRLIDFFEKDFARQSQEYALYEHAKRTIGYNEDEICYDVLKALFLFYEGKIKRLKSSSHVDLLAVLSGHSREETLKTLDYLIKEYDVIRFSSASGEYNFTSIGTNSVEIIKRLRSEIAGKELEGSLSNALNNYGLLRDVPLPNSNAVAFKREFGINDNDEWELKPIFLDSQQFTSEQVKIVVKRTLDESVEKGSIIYLIADEAESLERAVKDAEELLDELKARKFPYSFIIGIPNSPASQIKTDILIKKQLLEMPPAEKRNYEQSFDEAMSRIDNEIQEKLTAHLAQPGSVRYFVPNTIRMKISSNPHDLEEITSALFADDYKYRAPALSNILKTSGNKANAAASEIARQLISGGLNLSVLEKERQNLVTSVLTEGGTFKWGVLDSRYKIKEPKNPRVLEAWNLIYNNLKEDEPLTFAFLISKLTQAPFGYDIYTLTLLFSAFIGKYRYELNIAERGKTLRFAYIESQLDQKTKKFIEWLNKGTTTLTLAGRSNREKAEEYLRNLQEQNVPDKLKSLLSEADSILDLLPPSDELRSEINKTKKARHEFLTKKEKRQQSLDQLLNDCQSSNDIEYLLGVCSEIESASSENEENQEYAEILRKVNERIDVLSIAQAQIRLKVIEGYLSVKQQLEKTKQILHNFNRVELEELLAASLDQVEQDYHRLIAEKDEAPLLSKITSYRSSNDSLYDYRQSLEELEKFQAEGLSDKLKETLMKKIADINASISGLRQKHTQLINRASTINDASSAGRLRDDILRSNWLFESTPESEALQKSLVIIEEKISHFEAEKRLEENRQRETQEAERQRRALEDEKVRAERITSEFNSLTAEQYKCLIEMIKIIRNKGLSDTQKTEIISALEQ